jgi:hypothetical protein
LDWATRKARLGKVSKHPWEIGWTWLELEVPAQMLQHWLVFLARFEDLSLVVVLSNPGEPSDPQPSTKRFDQADLKRFWLPKGNVPGTLRA